MEFLLLDEETRKRLAVFLNRQDVICPEGLMIEEWVDLREGTLVELPLFAVASLCDAYSASVILDLLNWPRQDRREAITKPKRRTARTIRPMAEWFK